MLGYKLERIPIPPKAEWSKRQDEAYVQEILGKQRLDTLLLRCFREFRVLSATVRNAIRYFQFDADHNGPASFESLISRLEKLVCNLSPDQPYRDRFLEVLEICRFCNSEFERVLALYGATPKLRWKTPLAQLGDWLVCASTELDEALVCENPDFPSEWCVR